MFYWNDLPLFSINGTLSTNCLLHSNKQIINPLGLWVSLVNLSKITSTDLYILVNNFVGVITILYKQ